MIWYFLSFASHVFRAVSQAIQWHMHNASTKQLENEDKSVKRDSPSKSRDSSFKFDSSGRRRVQRTMSLSGGVDGTGQCIAVLTSGGDSQGN